MRSMLPTYYLSCLNAFLRRVIRGKKLYFTIAKLCYMHVTRFPRITCLSFYFPSISSFPVEHLDNFGPRMRRTILLSLSTWFSCRPAPVAKLSSRYRAYFGTRRRRCRCRSGTTLRVQHTETHPILILSRVSRFSSVCLLIFPRSRYLCAECNIIYYYAVRVFSHILFAWFYCSPPSALKTTFPIFYSIKCDTRGVIS